jgi:glycosyltransferase involved in cell wall biosynthesis
MKTGSTNTFQLINIIGIDGAGKTTLAKGLAEQLAKKDPKVEYRYCQYFAKLLYPVKLIARLFVMRKTDEFKDYKTYNYTKKSTSSRHPLLAGIYAGIWLFDYLLQSFFKITLPVLRGKRLIIDRYIFDIAVNLSLTTNRKVEFAEKIIKWFFVLSPVPDRVIFIDLPEEIAFARKDDIQDIEYLKERRERYLYLAQIFGFEIVDGTRNPSELLGDVKKILAKKKPGQHGHGKKTILYVHANNTDVGGADFCLFKLASTLDKKKFRPVVCLAKKTEILDLYIKEGIKTHIIKMERIKKSFDPVYLVQLIFKFFPSVNRVRHIIRAEGVDLVHGNDLLDIYGPVAGILEKKPTVQYVRWILESPVLLKKIITRVVYHINDKVFTVSDGVAKIMFAKKGRVLPKIITCYDWIDMEKVGHNEKGTDIRKEYKIPNNTRIVGCVGRLEFWKGQEVFIRAAARVLAKMPETVFIVVGGAVEGRNRESYGTLLKKLAKELGISNRVIFTGHRKDISNIMDSFDIFVHSSITPDPLPGVVMEAMYRNCPVVGADAGGVPEEVAANKTGLLYPPGDSKQMAKRIITLLKDPEMMLKMGLAGRKRVDTVFEKKGLCEKIQKIYNEMIQEKLTTGTFDALNKYKRIVKNNYSQNDI